MDAREESSNTAERSISNTNFPERRIVLTDEEREWMTEHPIVPFGVDPHMPPFSEIDEKGRLRGLDADIIKLISRRTGFQFSLVPTSTWTETKEKMRVCEVDFATGTALSETRQKLLYFTVEYSSAPVAIISHKDTAFLTSLPKLAKRKIAVPRGHIVTAQLLEDYPEANFILTDNTLESLRLVQKGKADATVMNLVVADYLILKHGLTDLKISGITPYRFPSRLAIRKDLPILTSILDKAVNSITPKEMEILLARYIGPTIQPAANWIKWWHLIVYALAFAAVVVSLVWGWNYFLKNEIKRRRAAEEQLRDALEKLETRSMELKNRMAQMKALNEELVLAHKDMESFSYSVSHDLQSPLRRMTSFVELLMSEPENKLTEESEYSLSVINKETRSMKQMISDLLIFSRVGRVELHREVFNFQELVNEVVEEFKQETASRNIVWKIGQFSKVSGDRNLLRQALVNLIGNAVKFTRDCSPAKIEVASLEDKSDGYSLFCVRDNGVGFEMKDAEKVFEVFHRLDTAKGFEGTGVGLANVKKIINRHGGRIWAESELNKGASFYFSLPRE